MIQIDTVSDKMSRCDISCKDIRLTDSSYLFVMLHGNISEPACMYLAGGVSSVIHTL